ncbi:MAG TPA: RusA family crossover junction endodeoxyribonuclease [Corynebacterium variabile]|uniref:RusA family crossover junction endodeoxyribonuclease n=1 Tax=Corynebacterium variabile TaxID=1727 RepID=A0A3B9QV41_9CORY|nr:RusA family crossover junction endodeoxyribonuclease [Corynebacterium variabile]
MTRLPTFFVPGVPAPQGSKRYVGHRSGKPVLLESSAKVKPWRSVVAQVALYKAPQYMDGPVALDIVFILPRPKSLPKRVIHMVKRPDIDKLARSTLDALSGVAYTDDNQVTDLRTRKRYASADEPTGANITIERPTE